AGTTSTDAPEAVSAIRMEFQLTNPQSGRGTLTAQFDTNGLAPTHTWTAFGTPPSVFAFTSQPVIFVFVQSGDNDAPSQGAGGSAKTASTPCRSLRSTHLLQSR